MTFLDEHLKVGDLPCYATDSPDAMPSPILYEGDLSILIKVIERMQNKIKELNIAVAAIAKDIRDKPNGQATAPLKLRPYGAIQMCILLLLLLHNSPHELLQTVTHIPVSGPARKQGIPPVMVS